MKLSRLPGLLLRLVLLGVCLSVPVWLVVQNFAVFEPFLYPLHLMQSPAVAAGPGLLVGPYPDHGELARLKGAGYKTVISLLSPDLAYEASLLRREAADTRSLGLRFVNLPMRSDEPADSPGNAAALRGISRLLAGTPGSRVYIHCYLGKHRARMASDWMAAHAPATGAGKPADSAPAVVQPAPEGTPAAQ